MYLRAAHAEAALPTLHNLIHQNPLGILTTAISSLSKAYPLPLIQCSHIPFNLDVEDESSETELGVLRGYSSRANPHCKAFIEALEAIPMLPVC